MGTQPEHPVSDLDRVEEALIASRTYFAAIDTADATRAMSPRDQANYSPIRTLCELGEEAFGRIRAQMEPTVEPCVPPPGELEGGRN